MRGAERSRQASRRTPAAKLGIAVAVVALLIFALFPAYWMVTTAFDAKAAFRGAQLLPQQWTFKNFSAVVDAGFGRDETAAGLDSVLDWHRIGDCVPTVARALVLGDNWLRFLRETLPGGAT